MKHAQTRYIKRRPNQECNRPCNLGRGKKITISRNVQVIDKPERSEAAFCQENENTIESAVVSSIIDRPITCRQYDLRYFPKTMIVAIIRALPIAESVPNPSSTEQIAICCE